MQTQNIFKSVLVAVLLLSNLAEAQNSFFPKLKKYCDKLPSEFNTIAEERKQALQEIGNYILNTRAQHKKADLLYICTHNSRRSQMGEVWGQTAAAYYGVDSVFFFSGGTEATAFNIRAANALKRAGFSVSTSPGGKNPKYFVSPDKSNSSWILYSKKYTDIQNPQQGFCAIMVCSEADKSCPVVPGAVARVSLPLEDPRYYDGTPSEQVKYDETSKQLAREMFFLFDYVKKQMNLKTESSK